MCYKIERKMAFLHAFRYPPSSNDLHCKYNSVLARDRIRIWNVFFFFKEGRKPDNPKKNPQSKVENQQQIQPTYGTGSANRTWATLVGDECSHHCAIPAHLQKQTKTREFKKVSRHGRVSRLTFPSFQTGKWTDKFEMDSYLFFIYLFIYLTKRNIDIHTLKLELHTF